MNEVKINACPRWSVRAFHLSETTLRMLSPRCSKSNASLILSKPMLCVTNSSIINSFFMYASTSFGALSTLFHPPNAVPFHVRPVTSWNGLVLTSVPDGATPTMTETPQPLQADSYSNPKILFLFISKNSFNQHTRAARIVWMLPTHSKV